MAPSSPRPTPLQEALERLARLAAATLHAPLALVWLGSEQTPQGEAALGLPAGWSPDVSPLHAHGWQVARSNVPLYLPDIPPDASQPESLPALRAVAAVPLPLRASHPIGALLVGDFQPRPWDEATLSLLHDLAATGRHELARYLPVQEPAGGVTTLSLTDPAVLRALFTHSRQATTLVDRAGILQAFNPVAEQGILNLYGTRLKAGTPLLTYIPEDARLAFHIHFERALTGQAQALDWRLQGSEGEVWAEFYFDPIVLPSGEIPGIAFTARPIGERKQAEAALRESEQRFRSLIEHGSDAIALLTPEGTFLYVSPSTRSILHYNEEEMVGRPASEFIHPDDLAVTLGRTEELLSEPGRMLRAEYRMRRKDGTWRWLEGVARNAVAEPGVRGIIINYRDVTERKGMEATLRESEGRYRKLWASAQRQTRELALLNQARHALTKELDPSRTIRAVVEAIAETFGYSHVSLYLVQRDRLILQYEVGYDHPLTEIPLSQGIMGRVVRTRKPALVRDVRADPAFLEAIAGTVSELCVPLWDQEQVVGVLNVESSQDTPLTKADLRLMTALSEHISFALQRARLFAATRQELATQTALGEANRAITASLDLAEVLHHLAAQMGRALDVTSIFICDYHPDSQAMTVLGQHIGPEASDAEQRAAGRLPYDLQGEFPRLFMWLQQGEPQVVEQANGSTLVMPLGVQGQIVAYAFLLDSRQRRTFTLEEISLSEGIAQQAAIAVQNAHLYHQAQEELAERRRAEEALRRQNEYLAVLHETSLAVVNHLDLAHLLEIIVSRAAQLVGTAHGFIYLVEPSEEEIEVKVGIGVLEGFVGARLVRGEGVSGRVWESGQPAVINEYDRWEQRSPAFGTHLFHAVMGVPLRSGARVVGIIGLVHVEPERTFGEDEVAMVERFAQLASIALDNARLYSAAQQELTERRRAEAALRESEERYALAAAGAKDGLWDWNLQTNDLYYSTRWKAMLGYDEQALGTRPADWFDRVHPDDLPPLRAALTTHLKGESEHFESEHRVAHRDGSWRWMLSRGLAVRDRTGEAYRIAGSQTDITERKLAEEHLLHEAFHDALTGLPNRALFMHRLERALRRAQQNERFHFAVLFLDFDRFKLINDSMGHLAGDMLLVAIARRLEGCLRPHDTVARLGGDEFTILLEDIHGIQDATGVAERVQRALTLPFQLNGQDVFISASIGIVPSEARYDRPEDILRDADIAMYQAKEQGKARHALFHVDMRRTVVTQLQMETDLRRAVERQEFRLWYQPILSLTTGQPAGMEALLRWQHPTRGLLTPGDFMSVAEETGLLVPLGHWILRTACEQLRAWALRYPLLPILTMSVNLSSKQVARPELPEQVAQILRETGVAPRYLKLEVMERALTEHAEVASKTLAGLRALGVDLQLDDFGTGYASLGYLHHFTITAIKIDHSFIRYISTPGEYESIIRTLINLAHNLGMKVIAEGVETEEQLALLTSLQCDYGQGYLFSPALESEDADALLRRAFQAQRLDGQRGA